MGFDMGGIDHQPFHILFASQCVQQLYPDAFAAPADKAVVDIFQLP